MAASRFKLEIIVPEKVYFSKEVDSLSVTTTNGVITILAHHTDLIGNLMISHMTIRENGHVNEYAIGGGAINIISKENKVVLILNSIESKEEIDIERAKLAKENAQKRLSDASLSYRDQLKAEIKLKRALNRIDLFQKS